MTRAWSHREVVPYWLVAAVVVLLVSVVGLGGWVLATRMGGQAEEQQTEVDRQIQAVAQAPGDLQTRVRLAYAYQTEGRHEEAIESYEYVLERDADNLAAGYNRALCLAALARDADAEAGYRAVLKQAPRHALAAFGLAKLLAEQDRYREMLPLIKPAADANPELADLQTYVALALENEGEDEQAIEYYEKALRLDPDFALARQGLTRVKDGSR